MTEDQHPTPQPENDTANPAVRVWPGGRQKMDSYSNLLTVAPFYYGSKRRWAAEVWRRFGQVEVYTEPFCGSAAVTLNCPYDLPNVTLYDRSSLICNLLRAVKADPEAVTEHCIRPLVHLDLIAAAKLPNRMGRKNQPACGKPGLLRCRGGRALVVGPG